MEWSTGDLIWFDPGVGHWLPGEILECHKGANVLTVQAVINGKVNINAPKLNIAPNKISDHLAVFISLIL